MLIGTYLTLLIGPNVPLPADPILLEAVEEVEVTEAAGEQSGFQIVLRVGRNQTALIDYPQLADPRLQPGSRVIITATVGVRPHVLFDGVIAHTQLNPASAPGETTLVLTGTDISLLMDLEEKVVEHPAQPDAIVVTKLLGSYARFGLIPTVVPPKSFEVPLPTERIPVQRGTDLAHIKALAELHDHVFTITPGPVPGTNQAYWGPPKRFGPPQPALSIAMGVETNVDSITFAEDSASVSEVEGHVQDRTTDQTVQVRSAPVSLRPPLALFPSRVNPTLVKKKVYSPDGAPTAAQAQAEVQAAADASTDSVTAEGELDGARYRSLLRASGLVGLRGVGYRYDGLYAVEKVTTKVATGSIKQSFTLRREGVGSTVPVVMP